MKMNQKINDNVDKLRSWLDNPGTDPDLKTELSQLYSRFEENPEDKEVADDISDRFYKDMAFGTGGLRGVIGAGTNRMNVHTVRRVSQAFSQHLLSKSESPSVVIAYDNRRNSDLFTFESACVFAANGIKVWMFEQLTPTPMLSFAVRSLGASGGVVVTASHNPKEYNGYKIYDENGCQCLPDEATKVSDAMEKIDLFNGISSCAFEYSGDVQERMKMSVSENELISFVPDEVNEKYYYEVMNEKAFSENVKNVNVVYTPLNGTGKVPVTTVLKAAGIGQLHIVENQADPDPFFTTCPKPNPEEKDALREGLKVCEALEKNGNPPDILMATDPDCDRIGIMVRDENEFKRLDGNQMGILLFDYINTSLKEKDMLPAKPVMITTIVSTPMAGEIADKKRIHEDKVLTGFKFIGGKIGEYEVAKESDRFIFGFEESCGYLAGTYVRDKDAVSTAMLAADMTGFYKSQNKTLIQRMDELYEEYGYYITTQVNLEKGGPEGAEEIKNIMSAFRRPEALADFKMDVVQFLDYEAQTKRTMGLFDGEEGGCAMAVGTRPISGLPKENVLEFNFRNRSKAIIRPSGTEPKVKIYFTSVAKSMEQAEKNMENLQDDFLKRMEKM